MRTATAASLAFFLIGSMSGFPHLATAQSPEVSSTIDDSDGVFIDGTTFQIRPGKGKSDAISAIKGLGARELGPGAIVFRSGQKLYIVDAPLRLPAENSANRSSVVIDAQKGRTNRIHIEYVPPENPDHQYLVEALKAKGALEMMQRLFSPFRLPADLTIKTRGCSGMVNAWYAVEESGPTVTVCYEYVDDIMKHAPMETTPDGVTREDAICGQFQFVIAHEMGHALFDLYGIPVFGREEDAADQFATYFMLHMGTHAPRTYITGAAYAYNEYLKNYQDDPKVVVPLKAFASNHGAPQERFFNLVCIAYGAQPVLFADVVEKGLLPKTRAGSCAYEFKTIRYAVHREIGPHLDWTLSRSVWGKTLVDNTVQLAPSP
ncbi:MAG TPA: DUF4344 domain-containing metallopeptidase [Xanthobacteraceae bacterium]|nr:DUF4344 domain-containing metallopeptidase [Xanthobacteraceae bacterium]